MGEYANDQIRADMKRMFGFDPGDLNDDEPKRNHTKPVYQRMKCPYCDAKPKKQGLWQHVRDVHGISPVEQALAKSYANLGET